MQWYAVAYFITFVLSRHIQVLIKVCTVAFLIQESDFSVSLVMFHIAEEQMLVANRFCIWEI